MTKILISYLLIVLAVGCGNTSLSTDPCKRKIRQPSASDSFKVYKFGGDYVVGTYELQARPDNNGVIHIPVKEYDTVFVRLVFAVQFGSYMPWPDNQGGIAYNTIWEKDSCKAKEHWFKYEKQWVK